jgi:hypothetical protein
MCITQLSSVVTSYCTVFQFTLHIYKKTQFSYIFLIYPLFLLILSVFGKSQPGFRRKNAQSTSLLPRCKFWRLLEEWVGHTSVNIDIWSVGILSGPLKGLSGPLKGLSGPHTHGQFYRYVHCACSDDAIPVILNALPLKGLGHGEMTIFFDGLNDQACTLCTCGRSRGTIVYIFEKSILYKAVEKVPHIMRHFGDLISDSFLTFNFIMNVKLWK